MTAVKLPRRLAEREPERSDPPSEADWLRRAIRHCEHWGVGWLLDGDLWPAGASRSAAVARSEHLRERGENRTLFGPYAGWLPEHLRRVPLAELRRRLEALEAKAREPA